MKKLFSAFVFACMIVIFTVSCKNPVTNQPPQEPPYVSPIKPDAIKTLSNPLKINVNDIYNEVNQARIAAEIDDLKNATKYTADNPLLLINPYGTNELSVYVYFESETPVRVWYTVEIDGVPDFTRKVTDRTYTTRQEFLATGFVPEHQFVLNIYTQKYQQNAYNNYQFSGKLSWSKSDTAVPVRLSVDYASKSLKPSDGLFVSHAIYSKASWSGLDLNYNFYDDQGYLRGSLISNYGNSRLLTEGDYIYDISPTQIAVVSPKTGKVKQIYDTQEFDQHHDLIFGGQDDLLRLVNGNDQLEDLILSINRSDGSYRVLLDFRTFFPGYDFTKNNSDWLHINSISLIKEQDLTYSLLVSGRELSAILKVADIYGSPSISWIITSNQGIKNDYPDYTYLQQTGGRPNLGQHTITYIGPDSNTQNYFIHFFNNNNDENHSNINFSDYDNLDTSQKNQKSFYEKYLINESEKTATVVDAIEIDYSPFMASTQIFSEGKNIIIGSAMTGKIYEYDSKKNLILQLSLSEMFYRFFKYQI